VAHQGANGHEIHDEDLSPKTNVVDRHLYQRMRAMRPIRNSQAAAISNPPTDWLHSSTMAAK
jgi:hypothetical protein